MFAIPSDVGGLHGENKITSMITLFEVAHKLGIPIVTMRAKGKSDDKEATKEEFKYIRRMSEEAASRGVTLAIKPHVGASVYNTATMIQMMDEIDSPGLGPILTLCIYLELAKMLQKLSASSVINLSMSICANTLMFPTGRITKHFLRKKSPAEAVSISLKFLRV